MQIKSLICLLVSSCICYSDTAGYGNETEIITGGKTERDPNDPIYQKMSRELVLNHLRIKEENIISIKVLKVTTQLVAGTLTKIDLRVILHTGTPSSCQFRVWEQPWVNAKQVSHKCDDWSKTKMAGIRATPRPEQVRDPKNPKYKKLAETSIDSFFNHPDSKPFKKEDIKTVQVTYAKVQIGKKIMNSIQFRVATVNNVNYQCTSTILETPWNPDENATVSFVNCTLVKETKLLLSASPSKSRDRIITGNVVYQNPDDPKYGQLTKRSFQKYIKTHKNLKIIVKEYKVTKVTTQVVSGILTQIDFYVIPTNFQSFSCHSNILKRTKQNIQVTCNIPPEVKPKPGGEVVQNPDDPMYAEFAKESFDKFQETHIGVIAKEFKVTKATKQVVNGAIYRIVFYVIPYNYASFPCHSKIYVSSYGLRDISVDCGAEKKLGLVSAKVGQIPDGIITGGVEYQNPDDPKYGQLTKQSFQKYIKSHKNLTVTVKEFKVTKVTTQVVSGILTQIDFYVIPTNYQSFSCHSNILEKSWQDIQVTCNIPPEVKPKPGGEVVQNPDDPMYEEFAKESFDKFQETHIGVRAKELKVTKATKQVVNGAIYRMVFYVIPYNYASFPCHSKISVSSYGLRDISVDCGAEKKLGLVSAKVGQSPDGIITGGVVYQNPDDPKYGKLTKQSFQKYIKSHKNLKVTVKEFKVTKVTTQVVSGILTQIEFSVIPTNFQSFSCHSNILEKSWKDIQVTCKIPPEVKPKPGGEVVQNPDDPMYAEFAKESFDKFQETHIGVIAKEFKVTKATKQVVNGAIYRIVFYVIPYNYASFPCHSKISVSSYGLRDISVDCGAEKKLGLVSAKVGQSPDGIITGGVVYQNPDDPKYIQLTKQSFQKYIKSHKNLKVTVKEFKVTKVTTQVVSGILTQIDFYVIPTNYQSFLCHSNILEKSWKDIQVTCKIPPEVKPKPGGEVVQNPDDPMYAEFAKESFDKFQETHIGVIAKEFKVTKATKQVVNGAIYRLVFYVIPYNYASFPCHSKISVSSYGLRDISVDCGAEKKLGLVSAKVGQSPDGIITGGVVYQNPDDPKYGQLTKQSFQKYIKSHKNLKVTVKEFKVTKVTTQVVSGILTQIDFSVIPTNFQSFSCHSNILKKSWQNIQVTCKIPPEVKPKPGGEVVQNPDDPKYAEFAKESFDKFQETHIGVIVKEFKVTKATKQVVNGAIYRIVFHVIPYNYVSFSCHSKISVSSYGLSDISVGCGAEKKFGSVRAKVDQNPDKMAA